MFSQPGPYRKTRTVLKIQTAFGLPEPSAVCLGECNFYYMDGTKSSLSED